ncbi:MAG: hypothetical protein Q8R55_06105 [Candidatus Taylorbacteria bacterium]|nr:hypothetical protein [Candidatus Taylorbacteria bacterium]
MKTENSNGFTIVEVVTAAFLISVGLLGAFALIERVATGTRTSLSRLTASYLSQEGIEIARNIRDTNLLEMNQGAGGAWNDGLTSCSRGCQIDYNNDSFSAYDASFLKNNDSVYSYDAGSNTKFQRKITITSPNAYTLFVVVDVFWQDRGKNLSFQSATQLFNWYSP